MSNWMAFWLLVGYVVSLFVAAGIGRSQQREKDRRLLEKAFAPLKNQRRVADERLKVLELREAQWWRCHEVLDELETLTVGDEYDIIGTLQKALGRHTVSNGHTVN